MSPELNVLKRLGIVAVAAAATALATPAQAESIRLEKPSQAASLHGDGVDMTVFYLAQPRGLELVATFAERASARPASQLRMNLLDGDDIRFVTPGRPDASFRFRRTGHLIEVESSPPELEAHVTN